MAQDDALIGVDSDANNVTTRILVNPYHMKSMVAYNFVIKPYALIDNNVPLLIVGASQNLADLGLVSTGSHIIYSQNTVPESEVDHFWNLLYLKPDYQGASSGVVGFSRDIFDKYFTSFTINYKVWNNDTQSYEDRQEWFDSPNDLTKYLLNLDPAQPMPWIPNTTIDPNVDQQRFVDFFARLDDLLNNPERADDLGRLICRTARGPPHENDVYQQLAVLSALSQDPLNQDDMYPTLVQLVEHDSPG